MNNINTWTKLSVEESIRIIIYSTLFAVEQYSSKKIDEKERETEQNNQKKQIYK